MKILNGSKIKIVCNNGLVESGELVEYTNEQMILKLVDKSIFIIQNPYNNILAIKVFGQEIGSSEPVYVDRELEPDQYYRDESLRLKSLADLRLELAKEERTRAKELLSTKKITQIPEVQFGYPNLTKPIYKHPKKKV
ncbi:MAG: hypothetical protein WC942_06260 [Clostridia bacterium]|jgi:hypothetical protein